MIVSFAKSPHRSKHERRKPLPRRHFLDNRSETLCRERSVRGDVSALDDEERARLRKQALEWLREDLVANTKQLEQASKQTDRQFIIQRVSHWQKDSDLASIRDEAALAKLPDDEREALVQLWTEVSALLKKASPLPKEQDKP